MLQSFEFTAATGNTNMSQAQAILAEAFGWYANGAYVWLDDSKTLGIYFATSSSSAGLSAANTAGTSALFAQCSFAQGNFLDYEKSKNGSAFIVGMHAAGAPPLSSGSAVFGRKTDGAWCVLCCDSEAAAYEIPAGSSVKKATSFATLADEAVDPYTQIYPALSVFGGVFEGIYNVFSCPAENNYVRFMIGGRVFQATNKSTARFAIEVDE